MYAKVINNKIVKYPYTIEDLGNDNPNISFPSNIDKNSDLLLNYGLTKVHFSKSPSYNPLTEEVIETEPKYNKDGNWYQTWKVQKLSKDTINNNISKEKEESVMVIKTLVKNMLNNKANEKDYDNSISICSYINSSNEISKMEAEKFIAWRDIIWAEYYKLLSDLENGQQDIKTLSPYNFIGDLPKLIW